MPTRHGLSAPVPAPHRLCRRSFLRIGALGLGGLTGRPQYLAGGDANPLPELV